MRRFLLLIATVLTLSACGQTGPLYLPAEPQVNQPAAEPAAE
ncbi:LPS translocon maturation chaperone LptM [Ferrimonas senticii]|nr:lipoprotein [Ferrimonas senticii]